MTHAEQTAAGIPVECSPADLALATIGPDGIPRWPHHEWRRIFAAHIPAPSYDAHGRDGTGLYWSEPENADEQPVRTTLRLVAGLEAETRIAVDFAVLDAEAAALELGALDDERDALERNGREVPASLLIAIGRAEAALGLNDEVAA